MAKKKVESKTPAKPVKKKAPTKPKKKTTPVKTEPVAPVQIPEEKFVGDSGAEFSIPDEFEDKLPPVAPEDCDPKLRENVYSRKAAEDTINFIEEEQKDFICPRFWETIRDYAILKCGMPVSLVGITPMHETKVKKFLMTTLEKGQFVGRRVGTVLKKDRAYLFDSARTPSPFQKKLLSYFAWEEAQRKAKEEKSTVKQAATAP